MIYHYTLYTLYPVYTIPCIHYTLYTLYPVYTIPCIHYTLYTLYPVYTIPCIHYTLYTPYPVYTIPCAVSALCDNQNWELGLIVIVCRQLTARLKSSCYSLLQAMHGLRTMADAMGISVTEVMEPHKDVLQDMIPPKKHLLRHQPANAQIGLMVLPFCLPSLSIDY